MDKVTIPDEKFICQECGTVLATEADYCPSCGAPMERYGDKEPNVDEVDEEEFDLSDAALHKGIDEHDDTTPLSLEALRDEEEDEDLDSYEKNNNSNSDE